MARFISMLRGINVSGQRKIRMAELRDAYQAVGLTNVNTYVQSGNVVFDCRMRSAAKVAGLLERQVLSCFGYDVTVVIRTPDDFGRIIKGNPFLAQAKKDPAKVHVTFLASRPSGAMVKGVEAADTGGDEFCVVGQEIFLHCPNGYGRTKLNNSFFERKLKMPATTRNWKTVGALYDMAVQLVGGGMRTPVQPAVKRRGGDVGVGRCRPQAAELNGCRNGEGAEGTKARRHGGGGGGRVKVEGAPARAEGSVWWRAWPRCAWPWHPSSRARVDATRATGWGSSPTRGDATRRARFGIRGRS